MYIISIKVMRILNRLIFFTKMMNMQLSNPIHSMDSVFMTILPLTLPLLRRMKLSMNENKEESVI